MEQETKKQTSIAIKKAKTSLESILKMIDEDKYCIEILQQILAVNGLLKSASNKILTNHLNTCFSNGMKSKNKEFKDKLVNEVIEVVSLNNKTK
jgi:CsoR family transcriptional regulator, copper-sensing transcriptional repressor